MSEQQLSPEELVQRGNQYIVHLYQQGQYRQALDIAQQLAAFAERELGPTHPHTATSLNNLAGLYVATNRPLEALPFFVQATIITDRMIGQVCAMSSENQRTAYLRTVAGEFSIFLSFVAQQLPTHSTAVQATLDLVLRRKAIGAEADAARRDAVLGGVYPDLAPQLDTLTALTRQIAQATLAGPGAAGVDAHRQQLTEWTREKERLEVALARQIPEMRMDIRLRSADREAVARAMPDDAVLVELVRYDVFNFHAVPALAYFWRRTVTSRACRSRCCRWTMVAVCSMCTTSVISASDAICCDSGCGPADNLVLPWSLPIPTLT